MSVFPPPLSLHITRHAGHNGTLSVSVYFIIKSDLLSFAFTHFIGARAKSCAVSCWTTWYYRDHTLGCMMWTSLRHPVSLLADFRQGWVLFERTCVITGIQFTKHFIEFVLVETNQFCGSNSNLILTRQTCSHRLGRVVGSKRWSLAVYFSVRIWYVFLISKYREELDLGPCMSLVRAKRMRLRSADFQRILRPNTFLNRKSALRSRILFARTQLMQRPRSDSPLNFDIENTYQIRTEK